MSKKLKKKEFHFNLGVLFRWIVFAILFYFSINYLSQSKSSLKVNLNTNVLGVNTQPVILKAQTIYEGYKKQIITFIDNQIVDIKKQAVTKIYDEIIKNIETSKK